MEQPIAVKYEQLLKQSVKARKLLLPKELADLPINCPNNQLLTDETVSLMDERDDLIAEFFGEMAVKFKIRNSVWCVYEHTDFSINPFEGATHVYYDGGWGEACRFDFGANASKITLLDVWKACDRLIKRSGDGHHVFIEQIEQKAAEISFWCGS